MKEKTKKQELPVFFTLRSAAVSERRYEFLEGALYVLTLLNGNNNHFKFFIFI